MSETPHAIPSFAEWWAVYRQRQEAEARGEAALRQPQPGTWQPIETAPKDWTHVLICVDGAVCEAYYRDDEELWCRANASTEDEDSILAGPTHWMPLPSPPQTETP